METPTVNSIQLEIERRAKDKINKIIDKLNTSFRGRTDVNDILERTKLYVKFNDSESKEKKDLLTDIFHHSNPFKEMILNANLKHFIEEETKIFLNEKTLSTTQSEKVTPEQTDENIKLIEKINNRIKEKETERKYLYNFLYSCYKGSDAKQKVEKHLLVIDAEISGLRFSLPNNIPF